MVKEEGTEPIKVKDSITRTIKGKTISMGIIRTKGNTTAITKIEDMEIIDNLSNTATFNRKLSTISNKNSFTNNNINNNKGSKCKINKQNKGDKIISSNNRECRISSNHNISRNKCHNSSNKCNSSNYYNSNSKSNNNSKNKNKTKELLKWKQTLRFSKSDRGKTFSTHSPPK